MSDADPTLAVRYAAGCDTGAVRDSNEDAAYASDRLLAVADGMRGPGGAAASAAAIDALNALELADVPAADLLTMLAGAVTDADRTVAGAGDRRPPAGHHADRAAAQRLPTGAGAHRRHPGVPAARRRAVPAHPGPHLGADPGRSRASSTETRPPRIPSAPLLVRALGGGQQVEADLALRTALPGDRYLLCSDGLSAVVDRAALQSTLSAATDPEHAVQQLIGLAQAAGAPDNIACVIADIAAA